MAVSYQFDNRGLYFTDSNGDIHLGHKLTIEEQLSAPFTITGILVSNNFVSADQLGQPITCHWNEIADNKQKEKRVFHGYLTEVQQLEPESEHNYARYRITLRPWLWLLTLRRNYRVFQQQNLSAILSSVFDDAGFSGNYTLGTLPSDERNYCVQYDETDFDFVTRLLAEQGIHYYFEHSSNSHQLTLHDPASPYEDAEVGKLDYISERSGEQQLISRWQPRLRVHSKSVNTVNYDYASSQLIESGDKTSSHTIANNQKLTQYHFGAHSVKGDISDVNSTVAENQLNKLQGDYSAVEGTSKVEELTLATQFSLANHPDSSQVGKYAIEAITHNIDASEQAVVYENNFVCRPAAYPGYPKACPKPQISGLQTAIVIGGDSGQPQHDASGRIKVQFHWDQVGGDSPSCWIRVAQPMASSSLGMQFIPRVDDEVLVSFVNSDPDQPVIIGSVYNSKNPPPYAELNSTQSGIKTQLGKTANEIRFDDKSDNEQLYFHAAKDYVVEVENNLTETITAEYSSTTEKAMTITGNDNYSLTVAKTLAEKAKEITITADDKITLTVGSNSIEISTSGIAISCDKLTIDSSGDIKMSGMNISSSSSAKTDISAGSNFSASASANAELSGSAGVTVSSSAQAKVSGSAGAELSSSAMTKVSSSGITQIQGSLVQVN
ncbi:type VI secretion system tip protein VgrG [Thalassomonas viridans]|uniref:Type VI secretion system tip protein VgrG n=1 Tax=Thalassomonas viridans TaxID=137584 RepID=A0AAF0C9B6_9GAMM|nr:type VI secretion system tip protein TssI/VgrG [Thalassomonas viridans]WDE05311.1 type VI secretion system tip protein VgrG [Thalassomonas viridans]